MSDLAIYLLAVALADLARSTAPAGVRWRLAPPAVGLLTLVAGALLGARWEDGPAPLIALALAAGALTLWSWPGPSAAPAETPTTRAAERRRAAVALAALGTGLAATTLIPTGSSGLGGLLGRWLESLPLSPAGVSPAGVLTVLALGLLQMSTGNRVVRAVLTVADVYLPRAVHPGEGRAFGSMQGGHVLPRDAAQDDLKGGRLLGPMERLLILGLGLAGDLAAAGIVVAAKGLIRWPELSRAGRQDRERDHVHDDPAPTHVGQVRPSPRQRSRRGGPGIHQITEYFLVGSFTSWLVALASLALAALALSSGR